MKHPLIPTAIAATWLCLLAACSPSVEEVVPVPANIMPEELKDCKFFRLQNEHGGSITVVRCPNSTVSTTQHQKNPVTTITIDGEKAPGQAEADAHAARVDAILKKIDEEIARLEAKKKALQ